MGSGLPASLIVLLHPVAWWNPGQDMGHTSSPLQWNLATPDLVLAQALSGVALLGLEHPFSVGPLPPTWHSLSVFSLRAVPAGGRAWRTGPLNSSFFP